MSWLWSLAVSLLGCVLMWGVRAVTLPLQALVHSHVKWGKVSTYVSKLYLKDGLRYGCKDLWWGRAHSRQWHMCPWLYQWHHQILGPIRSSWHQTHTHSLTQVCFLDTEQENWKNFCCSCCSVTKWYLTPCDPMDCSIPGLPVPHHLPEMVKELWVCFVGRFGVWIFKTRASLYLFGRDRALGVSTASLGGLARGRGTLCPGHLSCHPWVCKGLPVCLP